jgi:hypothetical protein
VQKIPLRRVFERDFWLNREILDSFDGRWYILQSLFDNDAALFSGEVPALTTSMEVCYRVLLAFGLGLFLH